MAMHLNRWTGAGNVGKDPEFKVNTNGSGMIRFSIAINERRKDKDGNKVEHTEWIPIVAWNKVAENMNTWLKSGSNVYIEAKLKRREWKDKETGLPRRETEVHAFHFQALNIKGEDIQGQTASVTPKKMKDDQNDFLGDKPYDSPYQGFSGPYGGEDNEPPF